MPFNPPTVKLQTRHTETVVSGNRHPTPVCHPPIDTHPTIPHPPFEFFSFSNDLLRFSYFNKLSPYLYFFLCFTTLGRRRNSFYSLFFQWLSVVCPYYMLCALTTGLPISLYIPSNQSASISISHPQLEKSIKI